MRLTVPTPSRRPSLPFTCASPPPDTPDAFLRSVPSFEAEGAPASVGTLTVLPSSFGSIYASETFRSFISTYNFSDRPVHAVALAIEVQTSSQRRISLVSTRAGENLPPRAAISHVVTTPLPDLGVHVLVCSASYLDRTGAARTLRQLFRFNVLPPLEPSVSVVPLHRLRAERPFETRPASPRKPANMAQFLVDLRIANTMPVPVYITSAQLAPGPEYRIVRSLIRPDDDAAPPEYYDLLGGASSGISVDNATAAATDTILLPPRAASMSVGDTRNFLFYVARTLGTEELPDGDGTPSFASPRLTSTPRPDSSLNASRGSATEASPAPSVTVSRQSVAGGDGDGLSKSGSTASQAAVSPAARREIGSFSLRWFSGTGEEGHMENVIVAYEPPSRVAAIELVIAAVPQDVRVQIPFAARCVARNNGPKPVRLYLQVRRDLVGEIVPVGISGISLGEVAPDGATECLLTLIPLTRGEHSISGLRVVDIDSRQSYSADMAAVTVN